MFLGCGKNAQNACFSLWFATFGASNIAKSALAFHSWTPKARAVGQNNHLLEANKMVALVLRNYFTFRKIIKGSERMDMDKPHYLLLGMWFYLVSLQRSSVYNIGQFITLLII